MSAMQMMLLAAAGGIVSPLPALDATDDVLNGPADATLRFETNGAVTTTTNSNGYQQISSWYKPNAASVGSRFWIRATVVSGTAPSGAALNTWLQLSAAAGWRLVASVPGSRGCTLSLAIATDAAGSNVVSTGTATINAIYET